MGAHTKETPRGTVRKFRVWRGDAKGGTLEDFDVEVNDGEVVLDIIHRLQATQTPDLAVRWNCKAGKCGSCSMEINGKPRLACMRPFLNQLHMPPLGNFTWQFSRRARRQNPQL